MKDLSQTVLAAAAKQMALAEPMVRLIEVDLPTPTPSILRLANYDRDVTFGTSLAGVPLVYKRYAAPIGEFRENRKGDLPQLQLNLCNVTLEHMQFIEPYNGLVGQRVRMLMVNAGATDDPTARTIFTGEVVSCDIDQGVAIFTLGMPSLNRDVCPARRVLRQCGVVVFGDDECGYVIPASPGNTVGTGFNFCGRWATDCKERGDDEVARGLPRKHTRRFNGYPGTRIGNP